MNIRDTVEKVIGAAIIGLVLFGSAISIAKAEDKKSGQVTSQTMLFAMSGPDVFEKVADIMVEHGNAVDPMFCVAISVEQMRCFGLIQNDDGVYMVISKPMDIPNSTSTADAL